MNKIIIDSEKCIGCGACVSDCVNAHLFLEEGKARPAESGCIECGHCFAICPEGAVKMEGYDCTDRPLASMAEFDSDRLLLAMKSRRSIRRFKDQPVEEEKLQKILEAGRYAPTASNAQDVAYTVLGSKQKEAEELCVKLFRKGKKIGAVFNSALKDLEVTDDFFFKGAPAVVVVSAKNSINAGLASSYMELMAYSLGLGVLYSGFFVVCTKLSRKLKAMLPLEDDHEVVSCLVIGYPDVDYKRIAPRRELNIKVL
ncbi:MAG: nitroreductase family protein [Christensenellaceae bacterium]|nr:nitroreductase family protein [Christensenellaceae bacterium]